MLNVHDVPLIIVIVVANPIPNLRDVVPGVERYNVMTLYNEKREKRVCAARPPARGDV